MIRFEELQNNGRKNLVEFGIDHRSLKVMRDKICVII